MTTWYKRWSLHCCACQRMSFALIEIEEATSGRPLLLFSYCGISRCCWVNLSSVHTNAGFCRFFIVFGHNRINNYILNSFYRDDNEYCVFLSFFNNSHHFLSEQRQFSPHENVYKIFIFYFHLAHARHLNITCNNIVFPHATLHFNNRYFYSGKLENGMHRWKIDVYAQLYSFRRGISTCATI